MKLNKKKIALFGTSADPPTIAHKIILEELSKIYCFTITYASNNPKKIHKEDITIRSLLLKTLTEDLNFSNVVFDQEVSSRWAFESIRKCKINYKLNHVDFVIGSDLIAEIFSWKNFDKIVKEVCFFIIQRKGYPIKSSTLKMLKTHKVNFKISSLSIPNFSSSMVRLKANYSNLPESLIDIVKKNNLYFSSKIVE